jgi:hypothetical protein
VFSLDKVAIIQEKKKAKLAIRWKSQKGIFLYFKIHTEL